MSEEERESHTFAIHEGILRYLVSGMAALEEKFEAEHERGEMPDIELALHKENILEVMSFLRQMIQTGIRDGVIEEPSGSDA